MVTPLLLDIEPAAEALSVGRSTMFRLISDGRIRTVTIGRRRLIERSELDRFIDELREAQ